MIPGITVTCAAETEPLGTGGGFLRAARASGEKPAAWLVLNGDTLAFTDLHAMASCLNEPSLQGVLLARRVPDAARYGTLAVGTRGELLGFEEKRAGQGIINAGVYWLRPSLLDQFPRGPVISLENDVFPAWVARGLALKVQLTDAPFLDIGTPETLAQAESFVQQNLGQFGLS
jgi:D-glycero-alpha-D-manno-heptose 1-phosphate guanylyltransferase